MSARIFTPDIKVEHVISFSDAVFAFAITLMALTIDIPDLPLNLSQSELLQRLDDFYPQFEDYVISFAVIATFWISYHQVFNHIKSSHISMVYLNLLFLLLITLLSLTTSFVTNYASYQIPYIIYCIVVIMASSLLVLIWWFATRRAPISRQRDTSTIHKGHLLSPSIATHNFWYFHSYLLC